MTLSETVGGLATLGQKLIALSAGEVKIAAQDLILRYQALMSDMMEENRTLRKTLAEAEKKLEFQGKLDYRDNLYWTGPGTSEEVGPYCPTCWNTKGLAVRMQRRPDWGDVWCQPCQHGIRFGPQPDLSGPLGRY